MELREFEEEVANATIPFHPDHKDKVLNWMIGLSGEVGEVAEVLKHHYYANEPLSKKELEKELGDVLWYLTALGIAFDISLEDIAQTNVTKLKARYPKGFDYDRSKNRKEIEEETRW